MEEDNKLWSDCIPRDLLGFLSSRLVAGEYFIFRSICKNWRSAPPMPPPRPARLHEDSSLPCLMNLYEETGIVEFFHPVYNALTMHKTSIPKLKGARIRSSRGSWLLMSHGHLGMFFFNPIHNDIIELPDLPQRFGNICAAWTFSCSPDSDCFVVGFRTIVPDVYIIKVGDMEWTYHNFNDGTRDNVRKFFTTGCTNPLFFNDNVVYLLGDKGNLGTLSIKKNSAPIWKFYGRYFPRSQERFIRKIYTVEDVDNGGMLAVFQSHEGEVQVWRYKLKGKELEREQITSLDNKTLFVSFGGCYLKPCVARGLGNKIYFPMFDDNNNGVFYCLATCKYYSFDYSTIKTYSSPNIFNLVQSISSIWIQLEND